jgi:methionyl-tRNA formyltransferase
MRALFFGTPAFAVPSLDALREVSEVVGVVCQPDKPAGRGLTVVAPPVKARAALLGIPVVQPTKLKTGEFAEWVRAQGAEVAVVVAYGRILPASVLAATRLGFVNVHASLLPKYRGAAPIERAIVNGEKESGITLMLLDEGMDTGDMLYVVKTPIGTDETAGELSARLSILGADAVREKLPCFVRGELERTPQVHAEASLAPMLDKQDGAIDWRLSAARIHDQVRGMNPRPGAFTRLGVKIVKVHATEARPGSRAGATPGQVILADKSRVVVACGPLGEDAIEIARVQLEGKRPVRAAEWVAGRGVKEGDVFASAPGISSAEIR